MFIFGVVIISAAKVQKLLKSSKHFHQLFSDYSDYSD